LTLLVGQHEGNVKTSASLGGGIAPSTLWTTLCGSAVFCHQSLGFATCQTVNCRQLSFSGCRPPESGAGILYRSTSSWQQHSSPSRNTWKRSYCNDRTH